MRGAGRRRRTVEAVVAELVADDGADLGGGEVLHQRVVQHDLLPPAESGNERIQVRHALRAVDDDDVHKGKVVLHRDALDGGGERRVAERVEGVEYWGDECRVNVGEEEAHHGNDHADQCA